MCSRVLTQPDYSFFLFGPRGTGKTTWLRERLNAVATVNLLLDEDFLPLLARPSRLRDRVEACPGGWVVIDEVQRLPVLLNEVHELITRHGDKYRYALTGSSARKLRRNEGNLLAGRAIERAMFPLVAREIGAGFSLDRALAFGTLPNAYDQHQYARDILLAYANTYLRQEIQQEALVKDLGSFHRFLRVAALMHGQVINASNIAGESAVARKTVERYFDILVDTLIAFRLPGWQPRAKVREHVRPKLYFFDCGVVRALADTLDAPLGEREIEALFEGYMLHEVRAAQAYCNYGGTLSYWSTTGAREVDLIWQRSETCIGFEFKATRKYRPEHAAVLSELRQAGLLQRAYVVYRGEERYVKDGVDFIPASELLSLLYDGLW